MKFMRFKMVSAILAAALLLLEGCGRKSDSIDGGQASGQGGNQEGQKEAAPEIGHADPQKNGVETQKVQVADNGNNNRGNQSSQNFVYVKGIQPPMSYYGFMLDQMIVASSNPTERSFLPAPVVQKPVVWINFSGGSVKQGYDKFQSYLLCKPEAAIPASKISADDASHVVDIVQSGLTEKGLDYLVTIDRPSDGDYLSIFVGGGPDSLGCAKDQSLAGAAPVDRGNIHHSDVAFVFSDNISSVEVLAKSILQDIFLSFGSKDKEDLNFAEFSLGGKKHKNSAQDVMNNAAAVNAADTGPMYDEWKTLVAQLPPHVAGATGMAQLLTMGKMMTQQPAAAAGFLDISGILGSILKLLPTGVTLPGIGPALSILMLLENAIKPIFGGTPAPSGSTQSPPIVSNPSTLGSIFKNLPATFAKWIQFAAKIVSLFGLPGVATTIQSVGNIFLPTVAPTVAPTATPVATVAPAPTTVTLQAVPMVANHFGLSQIKDPAELVQMYPLYMQAINQLFTGDVRDGLMSISKVAFKQALNGNQGK